jgi:hypothetical protein
VVLEGEIVGGGISHLPLEEYKILILDWPLNPLKRNQGESGGKKEEGKEGSHPSLGSTKKRKKGRKQKKMRLAASWKKEGKKKRETRAKKRVWKRSGWRMISVERVR